jgi:ATP-binding cassette subfamily B (MDR/TAP) protein 1
LSKAKVAAADFDRLYRLGFTTTETPGELRYPITGNVSFSKVNFAYPTRPDVPIFSDLSFDLRSGECVAIVGPSGSGKSTIAALLQRLYEPASGVILFDKHRLDSTDTRWLREHVAVVSQSANLFDASVTENIAYGSSAVPIHEIHRAARAANIHEFIMSLPEGYDTRLGENASLISGGQAQRLQIARALVRRSHILILDEATSALDVDNAKAILDTIVKIKEVSLPTGVRVTKLITVAYDGVHHPLGGSDEAV